MHSKKSFISFKDTEIKYYVPIDFDEIRFSIFSLTILFCDTILNFYVKIFKIF